MKSTNIDKARTVMISQLQIVYCVSSCLKGIYNSWLGAGWCSTLSAERGYNDIPDMPLLLYAFQGVDGQLFSPIADNSKIFTAREHEYACDLNDFS